MDQAGYSLLKHREVGAGYIQGQRGQVEKRASVGQTPVVVELGEVHELHIVSMEGWTFTDIDNSDRLYICINAHSFEPATAIPALPGTIIRGTIKFITIALRSWDDPMAAPVNQSSADVVLLGTKGLQYDPGDYLRAGFLNDFAKIPQDQTSTLTALQAVPADGSRNPVVPIFGARGAQKFILQVTPGFMRPHWWTKGVTSANFEGGASATIHVPGATTAAHKWRTTASDYATLAALQAKDNAQDFVWCTSAREWFLACNVTALTGAAGDIEVGFLTGFRNIIDDTITWERLVSRVVVATGIVKWGLQVNNMYDFIVPYAIIGATVGNKITAEWMAYGPGSGGS